MFSFTQFFHLTEELTKQQYTDVIISPTESTTIIRNASTKERQEMTDRDGIVGFLAHIPTERVYFFDRDKLEHKDAANKLGLEDGTNSCICGYYNTRHTDEHLKIRNTPRIRLSYFSTSRELYNPESFRALVRAFKNALLFASVENTGFEEAGDVRYFFRLRQEELKSEKGDENKSS